MPYVLALLIREPRNVGEQLTTTMTRHSEKIVCSQCGRAYFLDYQQEYLNSIADGLNKLLTAAQSLATSQHRNDHRLQSIPLNTI